MAIDIETFFGQRAIQDNKDYLHTRFENGDSLNFDTPPRIIDIHLGHKGKPCNLQCVWCFDQDKNKPKPKKWTPEIIKQFEIEIDNVINWKKGSSQVEKIYIAGGGEPTLYPEVANLIVDKFSQAQREVWLTTNGVQIKEPILNSIVKHGAGILVSIPGSNRDSYQENGGFDHFDKVLGTLQQLAEKKKLHHSSMEINVTHVLIPNTLDHLENFILQLEEIGVNEFRMRYDIFSDPQAKHNTRGLQIVKNIIEKYPNLNIKIILKSPQKESLSKSADCYSPFLWPTWNPLHGIFPCAHATDDKNKIQSQQTNEVYSLTKIQTSPKELLAPDCHRRC
ncbi:MAG: hypothetical protein DRG30_06690, partial [Epsilonproteobacteria bacterium]